MITPHVATLLEVTIDKVVGVEWVLMVDRFRGPYRNKGTGRHGTPSVADIDEILYHLLTIAVEIWLHLPTNLSFLEGSIACDAYSSCPIHANHHFVIYHILSYPVTWL